MARSAGGHCLQLSQTNPINFAVGPTEITIQLWTGEEIQEALLGMDVLLCMDASLDFKDGEVTMNIRSLKREDLQDHPVWAKGKTDCGLLVMEPVKLTGKIPPCVKQYPLNRAAVDGLRPIIKDLNDQGIIYKTQSPSNAPVWPVKKPNGSWRLTVDYRLANQCITHLSPVVASGDQFLQDITPAHKVFTVLDAVNAYWSVPLATECQDWLAFTYDGCQYTWARLAQGLASAPTIYHQALRRHLTLPEAPKMTSSVITYLDDILIASETEEEHDKDLRAMIDYLHVKGHKLSYDKAQMSQPEVIYIGQKISQGKREITHDRTAAIRKTPEPRTVKELRAFLGVCNYNRNWVENYTEIAQPLNDLLKGRPDSRDKIKMEDESRKAFEELKQHLCEAPALGLPNVHRPFTLFVNEYNGFVTSVLAQEHGGLLRAVGYYSTKLDTTALGFGPCLRAVQAVYLAIQLVNNLVLDQQLSIRCPHSVNALLAGRKVPCVSDSRWGNWQAVLESPNISLQKASVSNISTMIAPTDATNEVEDHVCEDLVTLMEEGHFVKEDPLHNPDLVLFTDGSSLVENGIRGAGYAVTTEHDVLESGSMDPGTSAQQAELKALTQALKIAEGKSATVYCDSRYALGVVMDFGILWKQRGFVTAKGTPIKNGELVAELLDAMLLPRELAVVKVKAHTKLETHEARGNALADAVSRTAARQKDETENDNGNCMRLKKTEQPTTQEEHKESLKSIMEMQDAASREEKWTWIENAAKLHDDNLWRHGNRTVAPQSLLPYLATQIHSLGHVAVEKMRHRFGQVWWSPKFNAAAKDIVRRCATCLKNNHDRKVKLPMLKVPAPPGPFRCLQVDYITLPPCKGYREVLVVVDKFSRWIEAYPVRRATAANTAKVLVKDFIPHYGLPDQICSDNGTHFTGAVCAEVSRMLNITWSFHCPYHPQSSGQVERANRTLKERLAKMHQEGTPWVDAMPIALCSMRATFNKDVGLSPYEVVFGRCFSFPGSVDLRTADVHLTSDTLMNYCIQLSEALQVTSNQVKEAWAEPPEGGHSLVPGQWVMIHKPQRLALEAKYEGPYQILLVTRSAVRVAKKTDTCKPLQIS